MRFQFGNYITDDGECDIETPSPETIYSSEGIVLGMKFRLNGRGRKHGANAAALTAAMNGMISSFLNQSREASAGLVDNDGAPTALWINGAQCNGGIKVVQLPGIVTASPGQYTTFCDYSFVLAGELMPTVSGANPTKGFDYHERLEYSPPNFAPTNQEFIYRKPIPYPGTTEYPQRQPSAVFTFGAIQTGEVKNKKFWKEPQPPLWPNHCHWTQARVVYDFVKGSSWYNCQYLTQWTYVFEADVPLINYPRLIWG